MFIPHIFRRNFFDNFFEELNTTNLITHDSNPMNTDIRELENSYELDMDLPGFKKEEIKVEVSNGYLIISACHGEIKEEGKIIRKERYSGRCNRNFYIGEDLTEEDITAKFENGVLRISVSKKLIEEKKENVKLITINE